MNKGKTCARIVESADRLFYEKGYEHTSFSDIADAVGISRGNIHHHFKSKDEILAAVINQRLANTQAMLDRWEVEGETPEERIRSYIRILNVNRAKIKRHGCPVGTLTSELAKLNHAARDDANRLFTLFRGWLRAQFDALGLVEDADALALRMIAETQGVATLANAFCDDAFVDREVERMCDWLAACAANAKTSPKRGRRAASREE